MPGQHNDLQPVLLPQKVIVACYSRYFFFSVPLLKSLSDQEFAKLGDVLEEVRRY